MNGNRAKKNKELEKDNRPILSVEKIGSGTLDENSAIDMGIRIPGRGKINIKISFEKE